MPTPDVAPVQPGLGPAGMDDRAEAGAARVLLALALLLALTRFLRLGEWGLWIDEAHTLNDALWFFERTPQSYPLGYLAVRFTVGLFGGAIDEATLRFFPALCGCLSIALAAWALRPAIGALRSNATALLLATSSWHLYWSQNARAYSLTMLLVLLGVGFWLRGLYQGQRVTLGLGLGLVALSAFAHPSGSLLLPGLVMAPLLVGLCGARLPEPPPLALLLALTGTGVLALGGWVVSVWSTYEAVKSGSSGLHFMTTTGWYMNPLVLCAAALGLVLAWRARGPGELLIALVLLSAGALALLASIFAKVAAQYVFVLLPLVLALATTPLAHLRRPAWRWAWVLLLALPGLVDSALYFTVRHGDRPRWKEAYAYVWAERGPNDLVLGMHGPVGEYYLRPGKTWLRGQDALVQLEERTATHPELWLRRDRRIWLVINPEDLMGWSPAARGRFSALLASEAQLQAEFRVPWTPRDMTVRVYSMG